MKYYKLTNQNMETHGGFQWQIGKQEEIKTKGGDLCSKDFFHCYNNPLLAVLLNPIHADIPEPRIFSIDVGGESRNDNGLKFGFKKMTLVKELTLPTITNTNKVAFVIYFVLEIYKDPQFVTWATNWLTTPDRSAKAPYTTASHAAPQAAAYAARTAAAAAHVNATVSYATSATRATAYAAYAAAAYATNNIDLIGLAEKAMQIV